MITLTARVFLFLFFIFFSSACLDLGMSEKEKRLKRNEVGEFIYRKSDERYYALSPLEARPREAYPWEDNMIGNFPRLTKEFFRCKGSHLNPSVSRLNDEGKMALDTDCNGRHSLLIRSDKEFVYPVLIEVLNFVQEKTQKRVVITSGHRCPRHNHFVDPSEYNRTSKHMVGAEVNFYVQGLEEHPQQIVDLLKHYYLEHPHYRTQKDYTEFTSYEGPSNVRTVPIRNKELYIKIFQKDEGRNFDNRHSYPYICIQVRYDRDLKKRVFYTWNEAYNHYFRW